MTFCQALLAESLAKVSVQNLISSAETAVAVAMNAMTPAAAPLSSFFENCITLLPDMLRLWGRAEPASDHSYVHHDVNWYNEVKMHCGAAIGSGRGRSRNRSAKVVPSMS